MKKWISLFLALLTLMLSAALAAPNVVSYTEDFYVADYANVLDDEVEGLIVLNSDRLSKACGAEIVVVTLNTIGSEKIENYAYTLFNEWKLGDEAKNNGLLILLVVGDGLYWCMPGKGLQDYVTAGDLDEMAMEHLIPYAEQGNYGEGIRQLYSACYEKVNIAYNAGAPLDETIYYTWLQTGRGGSGGAKYLNGAVRDMPDQAEVTQIPEQNPIQYEQQPQRQEGGFSIMPIIILIILAVVVVGIIRSRRNRPGQTDYSSYQGQDAGYPPMGGYTNTGRTQQAPRTIVVPPTMPRTTTRSYPRNPYPNNRGGNVSGFPFGGSYTGGTRTTTPSRTTTTPSRSTPTSRSSGGYGVSRTGGGGSTRGGGAGGSFARPSSSSSSLFRTPSSPSRSGGFGLGRSGGGGSTRGGGAGGSFRKR